MILDISSKLQLRKFGLRARFKPKHIDYMAKLSTLDDLTLHLVWKLRDFVKMWMDRLGLEAGRKSSEICESVKREARTAFRNVKRNPVRFTDRQDLHQQIPKIPAFKSTT